VAASRGATLRYKRSSSLTYKIRLFCTAVGAVLIMVLVMQTWVICAHLPTSALPGAHYGGCRQSAVPPQRSHARSVSRPLVPGTADPECVLSIPAPASA
jgi:hypothetical protein